MQEIVIKLDIPVEFKHEFELALAKVVKSLVRQIEFSIAKNVISKSEFTEEYTVKLSRDVNKSLHKRYKQLYPELQ